MKELSIDERIIILRRQAKGTALRIKALEDALTKAIESLPTIINTVMK
jgi:hypothetical protein